MFVVIATIILTLVVGLIGAAYFLQHSRKKHVTKFPKPFAVTVNSSSIEIQWKQPKQDCSGQSVLYREQEKDWKKARLSLSQSQENAVIDELKESTTYEFKVEVQYSDGVVCNSEVSEPIKTTKVIPSKPGKPTASNITRSNVELQWDKPATGYHNVTHYTVFYRSIDDPPEEWKEKLTKGCQQSVIITELQSKTVHYFKVRPEADTDHGPFSDISDRTETKPVIPGKPCSTPIAQDITHNSIFLTWGEPEECAGAVSGYTVFYRSVPDDSVSTERPWMELRVDGQTRATIVKGLESKVVYVFKVRPESKNGPGPESELSEPTETKESLAKRMQRESIPIADPKSSLQMYCLPKKEVMKEDGEGKMIAKYSIGTGNPTRPANEKVLMVVGATGAGKSTLINGIINFILGVTWEDDYRFKLIVDETNKTQAESQTSYITAYTFHRMEGSRVPYTLTLIDTPGFGDTRGIERDKIIVSQIKEFFSVRGKKGIDELHGIGFVTQAALARLTPTQKYIFDSILAVFGKNIADNIFMMTTFSDGQDPPVLEAIRSANIPFKDSFKFNNSALFVKQGTGPSFDKMFWELGIESFGTFFTAFERAESQSLQLTREVLQERHQLELVVKGIQPQINAGLNKIDELRQEERILKDREAELLANKDFTYKIKVTKQRKIKLEEKTYVTNCLICNMTCHKRCGISDDRRKYGCAAMDGGGEIDAHCKVCPGNCFWKEHVNNPYRFELYEDMEERTSDDLKQRFDTAKEGKSQVEGMIANMEDELGVMQSAVYDMIHRAQQCLARLQEIALKPNPLTEVEYIDLLIEAEKREKKSGFTQRVQAFEGLREQAVILKTLKEQGKQITEKKHIAQSKKDESFWRKLWPFGGKSKESKVETAVK